MEKMGGITQTTAGKSGTASSKVIPENAGKLIYLTKKMTKLRIVIKLIF